MPITSDHENGFAVSANELTGIRLQRSVVRSGNPKAHVLPSAKDSKTGRIEYTFTNQAALDKTLAAIKEWREPKQERPLRLRSNVPPSAPVPQRKDPDPLLPLSLAF